MAMSPVTESLPVLYSFRRCPYAMRGRMALKVSGIGVELREVILRDKPAAMLEASPKGTVPVIDLRHRNGPVIDESLAVMRWALDKNDPENWLGIDPDLTAALIAENDGSFKHHLDRYKYANRYKDANEEYHRSEGAVFLNKLNERLDNGENLFGVKRSLADIAIFPFVRQFKIADTDWFDAQSFHNVQAWLNRHIAGDLFTSVMEKYGAWQPGDAAVIFS